MWSRKVATITGNGSFKYHDKKADPINVTDDISDLPLESRCFEKTQIFQEEQKTNCAIIKPVFGIFF